ncbi:MAG: prepilin-type N-terminal cleavage/methylation domain-containing protein [Elusimicrobiaceae bacterium]|nr:prepilin-type N-terminal cleavage/methylation domain-containing protein [Elusimicrobiaceae bacterium]
MKKGFTMPEILVAVMIVTILVTMAVPMYERAVEKSRIAEVSMMLKRMAESKLRVMDDRNIGDYTEGSIDKGQLDSSFADTEEFSYRMFPVQYPNAVCATRLRGDHAGTSFLFLGEVAPQYCDGSGTDVDKSAVCEAYRDSGEKLFCQDATGKQGCDAYGMNSVSFGECNI